MPPHFFRSLCFVVLLAATASASASTVIRTFQPRFEVTARGALLTIGNTLMTCPDSAANCAGARAGTATGTGTPNNNNDYSMVWVNSDGVTLAPANSSTAALSIPAGSTVLFAGLYWGADSGVATRNIVRFATPAAGYQNTTAAQVDVTGTTRYSAFANVTERVQAGGSGTYKVSGIQATTGSDRYAGWALVVVISNPALPPRNMVVFDGYAVINSTSPTSVTTTVSGFRTPPTGTVTTTVGAIAYEGDLSSTGDSFRVNGTNITNAANPESNFFNSTITQLGVPITPRSPTYANQLGFDLDVASATGLIANNATSAQLTFTTGGETYYPAAFTFTTLVFEPVIGSNLVKSVTDLNGGTVVPGDILEYTLAYANTGNDGTVETVITDPIPANSTFVPGSLQVLTGPNSGIKTDGVGDDQAEFIASGPARVVFRVGTGASAITGGSVAPGQNGSVRFRVAVSATASQGTTITNAASITYREQTLQGLRTDDFNTVQSVVSNQADLSITKTNDVSSVINGSVTVYRLTVVNNGPAAANGSVLRDAAAPGLNCLTAPATGSASCEATGGAACPGGGLSGTIPVVSLQASTGVAIPVLPAGGRITVELNCAVGP